ncbi:ROK family glucokinase [Allonocardiopsis opalescens]|uniref:Glucokinase n=1 Tax=Allonocardiopsis opalescens TaxID=1144618 RepID=A0A2T0PZZ4_9ACTN|nr:ROK family glucokinase [Allonocardiopsis opalescens]PRX97025.1 glucokinase [Allonocardiopsis opalescens]
MGLAIGVDVGGTKVAAGVVDEDGRILDKVRYPTPASSEAATADVIGDAVEELIGRHEVSAVGIGAAGFVDENRSTVLFAPNLAWRDEPLKELLSQRVDVPVVVENDANAMAWAEYRFGAGRGEDYLVCITLGTGIGGGIVLNGQMFRGKFGFGAEVGHFRVVPHGRRCGCGQRGCWEQYASGRALVAEAQDLALTQPDIAEGLLKRAEGDVGGIEGAMITDLAKQGDPGAVWAFERVADWTGQGLATLAAILDPGRFVLGGGVSDAGDVLLEPVLASFRRNITGRSFRKVPDIRIAEFGSEAGIIGAADLARV